MNDIQLETILSRLMQIYYSFAPLDPEPEDYADECAINLGESALPQLIQSTKKYASDFPTQDPYLSPYFDPLAEILRAFVDQYPEAAVAQFLELISDRDLGPLLIVAAAYSSHPIRVRILDKAISLLPNMSERVMESVIDSAVGAPFADRSRLLAMLSSVVPASAEAARNLLRSYGAE